MLGTGQTRPCMPRSVLAVLLMMMVMVIVLCLGRPPLVLVVLVATMGMRGGRWRSLLRL